MTEKNIQSEIHMALSKAGSVIFRNNTGMAWQGKSTRSGNITLIKDARPLHAGLCEGSSDLVGWTPIIVTQDMVGKTVAIFTAIEVKSEKGRATSEQLNFISKVKQAGGIAGIARSTEEALQLVK